ncbi:hypothetical protein GGR76_000174 [Xanthomonas translucens]|nr:hypothetical protein [Xanthomonas campestris]
MQCDLSNQPLCFVGQALWVASSQRAIIASGFGQQGIEADWMPCTRGPSSYDATLGPVAVWCVIVSFPYDAWRMQTWLDKQACSPVEE